MKKISLALILSACAAGSFGGAVQAQERPPADTVVRITDPDAVARAEQNARNAQMSAQRASDAPMHAPAHKGMRHHGKPEKL